MKITVKNTLLALTLVAASQVSADECPVSYLEDLQYTDVECQYYLGTEAFRNGVYGAAASHWQLAVSSKAKYDTDKAIQATALSTLTFLTYQGLGVPQDKELAVKNWLKAVEAGDLEARRHLGFAYSDSEYVNNDAVIGLGWYESVLMKTDSAEALALIDQSILDDARLEAAELRKSLSDEQVKAAKSFAKTTL